MAFSLDGNRAPMKFVQSPLSPREEDGQEAHPSMRIEDWDQKGLEHLARYCARPPPSSERARGIGVIRRAPKTTGP